MPRPGTTTLAFVNLNPAVSGGRRIICPTSASPFEALYVSTHPGRAFSADTANLTKSGAARPPTPAPHGVHHLRSIVFFHLPIRNVDLAVVQALPATAPPSSLKQ